MNNRIASVLHRLFPKEAVKIILIFAGFLLLVGLLAWAVMTQLENLIATNYIEVVGLGFLGLALALATIEIRRSVPNPPTK